jgi:hypothetical protein
MDEVRAYRASVAGRLPKLAQDIAANLGGGTPEWGWRVERIDPDYGRGQAVLAGPGGAVLYVYPFAKGLNADWDRIVISGGYPHQEMQEAGGIRAERYSITVSAAKPAGIIAKDIKRRLFPEYLAELERVREAIRRHGEVRVQREAFMAEVAAMFGKDPERSIGKGKDTAQLSIYEMARGSAEVVVNGAPDTVNIKLSSIPREVAYEVLDVLAKVVFNERDAKARAEIRERFSL